MDVDSVDLHCDVTRCPLHNNNKKRKSFFCHYFHEFRIKVKGKQEGKFSEFNLLFLLYKLTASVQLLSRKLE